jgi:calcium-translocating P-type ATPase
VEPSTLRVVHLGTGRIRVHWPRWFQVRSGSLDDVLAAVPGAIGASGNSLTRNLLVVYDETVAGPSDVLDALQRLDVQLGDAVSSDVEAAILDDEDRAAIARGTALLAAAAVGLGVTAARRLLGGGQASPASVVPGVALGLIEDFHVVATEARRPVPGPPPGDFGLKLASVVALAWSRSPLGLALLALTSVRALTAAQARADARRAYARGSTRLVAVRQGDELDVADGARAPLPGIVVAGRGIALDRAGCARAIKPGDSVDAGASLHGSSFRIQVTEAGPSRDGEAPLRRPHSAAGRYELLVTPIAAAAALAVLAVTRSRSAALTTLLVLDPHPAVVGAEVAAESASACLARAGLAVRSTRSWFVRTPDVLIVDGLRPLLHLRADARPELSAGAVTLLRSCREHGVTPLVALAPDVDPAVPEEELRAAGLTIIRTSDLRQEVRARQSAGSLVGVLGDSAASEPSLVSADLGIAVTSGLESLTGIAADLLVPDLEIVDTVLAVARRREQAEHVAVALSIVSSLVGIAWELMGRPRLRQVALETGVASLAAAGFAWWRVQAGSAHRHADARRLADPRPEQWGAPRIEEIIATLATRETGLTSAEASARLRPRPAPRERSAFVAALVEQLRSPMTAALGIGALLSLAMRAAADVGLIGAVVGANATIGAVEEARVGRAVEALEQMGSTTAAVLRDGAPVRVPAAQVVPGDVLLLSPGDRVPADARLIHSRGLQVDEATLTGESLPVEKDALGETPASRVVLEGSDVTVGHARALVFAVGSDSRLGATAAALGMTASPESPLNRRLSRMVRELMPFALGGAGLVVLAGLLRRRPLLGQLAIGASTAIAAVPEGLPLLARIGQTGVGRRLADRNVLVRHLSAVEALGRVDVACVDKTGTLTTGKLTLQVLESADEEATPSQQLSEGLRDLLHAAAIASPRPSSSSAHAHPTDVAVLEAARTCDLEGAVLHERDAEAPFDPARAFHAALLHGRLCVKGSPETVIERCSRERARGRDRPLDAAGRTRLLERVHRLAERGYRVLLVAEGPPEADVEDPRGLAALGLLGIADSLRPGTADAVHRCRKAGVRMIMLTGDHPETAREIARRAGIEADDGRVLTGSEIQSLTDDELADRLQSTSVIARIAPLEKVRVVTSLQSRGHVVAMTGDGVNDAPALRLADVGVAMGRSGTEVARQAADVVLADDDVATLVDALIEGRTFWSNVRRSLGYLLGGNLGEIGFLVGAALVGPSTPITARQILAVNLGSDVLPALALVVEEPRTRDLEQLAREGEAALEAPLRREIVRRGAAIALPSLAAYLLSLRRGTESQSVAYGSIVGAQLAHALEASVGEGALGTNGLQVVGGSVALLAATLLAPPLRAALGLRPLSPFGWVLVGLASGGSVALERALRARSPA